MISNKKHTLEIPMLPEDFAAAYFKWKNGANIQDAFPNLSPSQREFIMTGTTEQEWNTYIKDKEEE